MYLPICRITNKINNARYNIMNTQLSEQMTHLKICINAKSTQTNQSSLKNGSNSAKI